MSTPWLLKETSIYLDPHQRCQDFYPTSEGLQYEPTPLRNIGMESSYHEDGETGPHLNMVQSLTKDHGRLVFLPDGHRGIWFRVVGAARKVLEFQLVDFSESPSVHPLGRPVRVHFGARILPSVEVLCTGGSELVCWVCLVTGPVVRLLLNASVDFSAPGRSLVRQQFAFQGLESELTVFKALDATSVVAATAAGALFHGLLVDQGRTFICKSWKQTSLMASLLSPLSRFVKGENVVEAHQTVALACLAMGDGTHLVFSLSRDRVVRVWSTRTHQQVQTIPLANTDINGKAIEPFAELLPPSPTDSLRVDLVTPGLIRLMVHSNLTFGPAFLIYNLKVQMGEVGSFDLDRCLKYRNFTRDAPKLVDFYVTTKGSADLLFGIWDHLDKRTISYLPFNFAPDSQSDYPFLYDCERWLPIAPETCERLVLPTIPSEASTDDIFRTFLEFLGRPNHFTLREIKYAADLHFRDNPNSLLASKSYETPQALFTFLKSHMGASLPKNDESKSRLVEEWTNFIGLCMETKSMMHKPVSISGHGGVVFTVYGDSIGTLRTCDPIESLDACVTGQLPRFLEKFTLAPFLGEYVDSIQSLTVSARLVELFKLARSIWDSPDMVPIHQKLCRMIEQPDSSSTLNFLSHSSKAIFAANPKLLTLSHSAHQLWHLLQHLLTLLDSSSHTPAFPPTEAPSGWFLHDALVASTFRQLVLCRSQLTRDLLLIFLAAASIQGLDALRSRECLDGVDAAWRYFGTQFLFLNLFKSLPLSDGEKRHTRRPSTNLALDISLSKFYTQRGSHTVEHHGLQTPPYYWYSLFQGFMRTVAKPVHLLAYGLTSFSLSLLPLITPGPPETNSLFYQLLTWLEIKGEFDTALLFTRYLKCLRAQNFLTGRILLSQGNFSSAYASLSSVAVGDVFVGTSEQPLRGLLPNDLLAKGLPAYLSHMATWFQAYDAYEWALLFCHRALVALPQQDEASATSRDTLWKISFELNLSQKNYPDAYYAVLSLEDKRMQAETLRVLMVTMCAEERVDQLCRFPFPGLESTFEAILWDLIYFTVDFETLSVNYFDILANFYLIRQDTRNAASAQYHYLLWLTRQSDLPPDTLPAWLDQQVLAAQFSSCNLGLLPEDSTWIKTLPKFQAERERLTPYFGPTTAPLEVVTHEMLSRLHLILIIQRDFSSIFPHYQLIRNPVPPQDLIASLLAGQAFPQAIQVSVRFQLNLSPVFHQLAEACIKVPELQDEDSSPDVNPWSLLKSSLDQFSTSQSIKPGEYELRAISSFLGAGWGDHLPSWLLERASALNQTGVIDLLLHHSCVEQSADLAAVYLKKLIDQTHLAVPTTFSQFLPINLMDRIAKALELKKNESQLASFKGLLDQYLAANQAGTGTLMKDRIL